MTLRTAPGKAFPLNKKGVLKEINLSQFSLKKLLHLNVNEVNSRLNMLVLLLAYLGLLVLHVIVTECPLGHEVLSHKESTYDMWDRISVPCALRMHRSEF